MKKHFRLVLTSIWLAMVSIGMGVLLVYEHTPSRVARVPVQWPAQSKIIHVSNLPTLVMFAHPRCPCTRASIGELTKLMTHCQHKVLACVVFLQPKGCGDDWLHTDLWRSAEAIPGVMVRADEDGKEAGYFQATTSGQVVLYGVDGKLLFSGGITSSRGHFGDNEGCAAITKLVHHELAAGSETPVFGCSLLNPTPADGAQNNSCTR
jgi:hypothetical protein